MNRFVGTGANNYLLAFCFALLITLSIVSIGQPLIYERVVIGVLVVVGIAHYQNKDVFSLFCILLIDRTVGEIVYGIPDTSGFAKILLYSFVFFTAFILRYQLLSKLILLSLLISVPAEIYWFKTGYDAPTIIFYYLVVSQIVIARYFLLMRPVFFRKLGSVRPQSLDFNMSEVYFLSGVVNLVMITEYIVRHLSGLNILVVYMSYEYIQQCLTCLYLMVILCYSLYQE